MLPLLSQLLLPFTLVYIWNNCSEVNGVVLDLHSISKSRLPHPLPLFHSGAVISSSYSAPSHTYKVLCCSMWLMDILIRCVYYFPAPILPLPNFPLFSAPTPYQLLLPPPVLSPMVVPRWPPISRGGRKRGKETGCQKAGTTIAMGLTAIVAYSLGGCSRTQLGWQPSWKGCHVHKCHDLYNRWQSYLLSFLSPIMNRHFPLLKG